MGFSGQYIVESNGQAGGIWCLWNDNSWKVEMVEFSSQFVHLRVQWKNQASWLVAIVYASPNCTRRQELWNDLHRIADSHDEALVVLGDFNSILVDSERRGGAADPSNRGRGVFREIIQYCNLIDAGFQGSPYTWRKGSLF